MSLKAIEMQIALPRTQDAGKLQEQQQQRSLIAQNLAADLVHKEEKFHRSSVVKQQQKGNADWKKEQGQQDGQQQQHGKKNQKKDKVDVRTEKHPYKGTFIDFSG